MQWGEKNCGRNQRTWFSSKLHKISIFWIWAKAFNFLTLNFLNCRMMWSTSIFKLFSWSIALWMSKHTKRNTTWNFEGAGAFRSLRSPRRHSVAPIRMNDVHWSRMFIFYLCYLSPDAHLPTPVSEYTGYVSHAEISRALRESGWNDRRRKPWSWVVNVDSAQGYMCWGSAPPNI